MNPEPGTDSALLAAVHRELHALAFRYMSGESPSHTLQATALVNEAFLRLRGQLSSVRDDPARFYFAAAEAMRRILVDHARRKGSLRRGGDLSRLPLDLVEIADRMSSDQVLALEEALRTLGLESSRAAAIVRLRFFTGLSEAEVARVLRVSLRTVRREWAFARAWLYRALADGHEAED